MNQNRVNLSIPKELVDWWRDTGQGNLSAFVTEMLRRKRNLALLTEQEDPTIQRLAVRLLNEREEIEQSISLLAKQSVLRWLSTASLFRIQQD